MSQKLFLSIKTPDVCISSRLSDVEVKRLEESCIEKLFSFRPDNFVLSLFFWFEKTGHEIGTLRRVCSTTDQNCEGRIIVLPSEAHEID